MLLGLALNSQTFAGTTDTTIVEFNHHKYYHISSTSNKEVLVFLHGGVNNPTFLQSDSTVKLDYLLEGNSAFITACLSHGIDVILPITSDSLNWLNHPKYCHEEITRFVSSRSKKYEKRFIGGFSDGGTGSYKIFYSHPSDYAGLLVFNGYPQHKNFNKTTDYQSVSNKKVFFISTQGDNVIPYEFLLTEYLAQKKHNPNTLLYVVDGKHSFDSYTSAHVNLILDLLVRPKINTQTASLHGLVIDDVQKEFYPYRKKIFRKFRYGKQVYDENKLQQKEWKIRQKRTK